MDPIKYMDIAEFRSAGYLQEVNRRFLHPLGLALEVEVGVDGFERLGGVWDYRDEDEGVSYGPDVIDPEKAARITAELALKARTRAVLGYIVQPVPETWSDLSQEERESFDRVRAEARDASV